VQIVLGALLVSVLLSLTMGVMVGLRPNGWLDRILRGVAMLGIAIPNFLLGLVLMLVFAVWLQWLPAGGYRSWAESGTDMLRYLALPVGALAVALICQQMRTLRASLLKEYQADYVRSARMKNLSETEIFFKHVLRNASAPLVTVIGLEVGALVTGSILVESVFAVPGVGTLMVESVHGQDFAVVQALVLLAAVVVLLANLAADVVALWLNPTARSIRG
jgi:peptide/nickel transport system permease protein